MAGYFERKPKIRELTLLAKMRKMPESLRVLKLLLYKNYLVRKRQWLMSLIGEVLIPVGILSCVWAVRDLNANIPQHVDTDSYYPMCSKADLIDNALRQNNDSVQILYAPDTAFTSNLMSGLKKCFRDQVGRCWH